MENDIFTSTVKIIIAQVGFGISGLIAIMNNISGILGILIAIGTFTGLTITAAYTVYKWRWSIKFNRMEYQIKKETLKQLKDKAA